MKQLRLSLIIKRVSC